MSYHNHPGYCDGSGSIAEYAEVALQAGVESVGVSCHAPVPFACSWTMPLASLTRYAEDVRRAREEYRERLPIAFGLEVDYLAPTVVSEGHVFQREHIFLLPLDYVVASVHFVGLDAEGAPWTVDHNAESFAKQLAEAYRGDVGRLLTEYYEYVVALARTAATWDVPVIVGHVDKVKMWNIEGRYFDEDAAWYRGLVEEALQSIRATDLVIEVNTSGMRRAHGEPYPGPRVLRRCRELGIPVTISSDAHKPADLVARFDEARDILWEAGYRETVALVDGRWTARPLR